MANTNIQHIINDLYGFVTFIDLPKTQTPGSEWLFQPIIINDTFIDLSGSNEMILSKYFDGIILLQSVSVPEK